ERHAQRMGNTDRGGRLLRDPLRAVGLAQPG
ncbi:MAG: hypothetical protein QOF65_1419, partial [Thermoleophilaceae bacterium]|nr:hypothetical protein [Thermoleophilaceae bacterium]